MAAKHPPTYDCTVCNRSYHAPFALEDHYRGSPAHPNCGRCGRGFRDAPACEEVLFCSFSPPFLVWNPLIISIIGRHIRKPLASLAEGGYSTRMPSINTTGTPSTTLPVFSVVPDSMMILHMLKSISSFKVENTLTYSLFPSASINRPCRITMCSLPSFFWNGRRHSSSFHIIAYSSKMQWLWSRI